MGINEKKSMNYRLRREHSPEVWEREYKQGAPYAPSYREILDIPYDRLFANLLKVAARGSYYA